MLTLEASRLFDGERLVEPPMVAIDDGRVIAVGDGVAAGPDHARFEGATLVPGMVDCHQHLCFDGYGSLEEQMRDVDDGALVLEPAPLPAAPQRAE